MHLDVLDVQLSQFFEDSEAVIWRNEGELGVSNIIRAVPMVGSYSYLTG